MTIPVLIYGTSSEETQHLAGVFQDTLPAYCPHDFLISQGSVPETLREALPGMQNGLLFYLAGQVGQDTRAHVKSIQLSYPHLSIVLVSKIDHAYDAWELEVDQFVASPSRIDDLLRPVRRYVLDHSPKTSPLIKLKYQGGMYQIKVGDILYCRADGNYCHIYLASGNKLVVTAQINKINEMLQAFDSIQRVGRSFLFNLSRIKEIEREQVSFNNSAQNVLKLSTGYVTKLKHYLLG